MEVICNNIITLPTGEAPNVAHDEGGWDTYGQDWRFYFDCMISPIARQACPFTNFFAPKESQLLLIQVHIRCTSVEACGIPLLADRLLAIWRSKVQSHLHVQQGVVVATFACEGIASCPAIPDIDS